MESVAKAKKKNCFLFLYKSIYCRRFWYIGPSEENLNRKQSVTENKKLCFLCKSVTLQHNKSKVEIANVQVTIAVMYSIESKWFFFFQLLQKEKKETSKSIVFTTIISHVSYAHCQRNRALIPIFGAHRQRKQKQFLNCFFFIRLFVAYAFYKFRFLFPFGDLFLFFFYGSTCWYVGNEGFFVVVASKHCCLSNCHWYACMIFTRYVKEKMLQIALKKWLLLLCSFLWTLCVCVCLRAETMWIS